MRRFQACEKRRSGGARRASPVTSTPAAPVMAVPAAMPTPVTAVPVPVPMMSPAHFLGLDAVHFGFAGDGGTDIGRQPDAFFQRMRREGCSLRTRRQRSGARGKSNGEFQKVAAVHVISSCCMASDAGEILIAPR